VTTPLSSQFIGFLPDLQAFSTWLLFVVTKRFQKRPDKRNSLRLRLRSDSLLSQWKGLFYAFALFDESKNTADTQIRYKVHKRGEKGLGTALFAVRVEK